MPALFVTEIELAWQTYKGEPQAIKRALLPQTVHERIALALFFGDHSLQDQAAPLMKEANYLPAEEKVSLLKELLDNNRYAEAYEVWLAGRAETEDSSNSPISDGGFEGEFVVDDPGFGWRFNHELKTVNASLDQNEPHSGKQSLRLDWHGDPDRLTRIVEQLVLAAPKTRYRVSFSVRTQSLTTICAPLIVVVDPKIQGTRLLGQSSPISEDNSWRNYSVEFTNEDTTTVILIGVTREDRPNGPCPIFGSMWLDDFSLVKI
jgi:hypothetical protein